MHDIFLSYSRTDTDTMQRIKHSFRDANFTVWTDEGIEPGTRSWKRAIQKAILETGCLVCILSPDAVESRWVQEELDFAELHEKPIFLILARGNQRNAIPFGYATHQWVDIRDIERYETRILKLVNVIQRRLWRESGEIDSTQKITNVPSTDVIKQKIHNKLTPSKEREELSKELQKIMPEPFDLCLIDDVRFPFYMGKYPITNRQFSGFIDAGGYNQRDYWDDAGWELSNQEKWTQPRYFHDVKWNSAKQPVVGVTYYEAEAFCKWLSDVSNKVRIYLPGSAAWLRAARGIDENYFPWGNAFDSTHLNGMNIVGKTSPVDQYPEGSSPYGVMDMCGNVWEWCNNPLITLIDTTPIRGGSWIDTEEEKFRVDYENSAPPSKWYNFLGFRIACKINS